MEPRGSRLPGTTLPGPAPEVLQVRRTPSGGDPGGFVSGMRVPADGRPCRTRPPPTSSMGEAPLLGNVQPRSAARNFAIYEQGGSVPLAPAASVHVLQGWAGQGGLETVDQGEGGDPPAEAVPSGAGGISGPACGEPAAASEEVPGRELQTAPSLRAAGAPAALACPAECHTLGSKGKGPAEGVSGGPTAHDPRRRRRALRGDAATAWPAHGQGCRRCRHRGSRCQWPR